MVNGSVVKGQVHFICTASVSDAFMKATCIYELRKRILFEVLSAFCIFKPSSKKSGKNVGVFPLLFLHIEVYTIVVAQYNDLISKFRGVLFCPHNNKLAYDL